MHILILYYSCESPLFFFARACKRIVLTTNSGEYCAGRRKRGNSFQRNTVTLSLCLLFPDFKQRFALQKQNLFLQYLYALSQHHCHLQFLWTQAPQGYSTDTVHLFGNKGHLGLSKQSKPEELAPQTYARLCFPHMKFPLLLQQCLKTCSRKNISSSSTYK